MLNNNNDMKLSLFFSSLIIACVFTVQVKTVHCQIFDFSPEQVAEYRKEAEMHFENNNYNEASRRFNDLGFYYWEHNNFEDAIEVFKMSVKANEQIGNVNAVRHIYNNFGQIYYEIRDFDSSIKYQKKGLDIARSQNRDAEIASSLINLATTKTEINQHERAINNLNEALQIATELNELIILRSCYALLARNHDALGNNEKAREYYDLFDIVRGRIQEEQARLAREEAARKVEQVEAEKRATAEELTERQRELVTTREVLQEVEHVSRERQMQIDLMEQERLLLERERMLQEEEIRREKLLRNFLIAGSGFVAIFALLVLYALFEKRKANKKLSAAYSKIYKQNENITNSIAYAQRIQEAVLPLEDNFTDYFNDSFIFFRPRDVVSGDFYWFRRIASKDNPDYANSIIVAAVDCTGHGVPGAFMSMIGVNFLENITRRGIIQPAKILNELHKTIRKSLKQHKNDNRDGMEMSIAVINEDFSKLEFAGAKNPLIYTTGKEIEIIKGDPAPIGGLQLEEERLFTNYKLDIKEATSIYLYSDGFADQFGGPEGEKFSSKRLRDIFARHSDKPMIKQKELIEKSFNEWKGDEYNQLDDVLVLGFRINK